MGVLARRWAEDIWRRSRLFLLGDRRWSSPIPCPFPHQGGRDLIVWALLLTLASGPAAAQTPAPIVSQAPDTVAVTLYRGDALPYAIRQALAGNGLALITERRSVELPAGPVVISFRGVADTLVPQTAQVQGLAGPIKESDFDYALLSPGALIAKSLDRPVHLVRTNPKTGQTTQLEGVLRSGPDGVVIDEGGGAVEALNCSGLAERLVFDAVPAGLADKPTLSVRTIIPHAGRYALTLSYLATGFNWSADYVARLNSDGKTLDLSGWLTLTNASATGFRQAPVQVVAGRLARTGDDRPVAPSSAAVLPRCWAHEAWWSLIPERSNRLSEVMVTGVRRFGGKMMALAAPAMPAPPPPPPPPPMAAQSELGDYKLYTLPEPTTVAANQTKQVRFLDQSGASYRRVYRYTVAVPSLYGASHFARPAPQLPGALITLKLVNEASQGLGAPLPSGHVVVMTAAGGRQMFVGGERIEDTPTGGDLALTLGRSPLVSVTPEVVSVVKSLVGRKSLGLEVTAANASAEAAVVEIRQYGGASVQVQTEDQPHTLQGGHPCWTVTVPPGGRVVLHYSLIMSG